MRWSFKFSGLRIEKKEKNYLLINNETGMTCESTQKLIDRCIANSLIDKSEVRVTELIPHIGLIHYTISL